MALYYKYKRYRVWSDEHGIYVNFGGRKWRPLPEAHTDIVVGRYVNVRLREAIIGPLRINDQEMWCSDYGPSKTATRRLLRGTPYLDGERSVGMGRSIVPTCEEITDPQMAETVEHLHILSN